MTVREIYDAIDRIAPFQTAMDFDNVGILIGDENADVTKTLLCLDVTPRVLREAKSIGVELIRTSSMRLCRAALRSSVRTRISIWHIPTA